MDNIEPLIKELLGELTDEVDDENLIETPRRVARAWRDQLWGYRSDPREHLRKTFEVDNPGLVIQTGIDVQSVCAHHLLPFGGTATVAYQPRGSRVVGLSKLTRVVYGYAARLQLQERIGSQVVAALRDELDPMWAVCLITASHDCMRLRGVRSPSSVTTTLAVHGDDQIKRGAMSLVTNSHTSSTQP